MKKFMLLYKGPATPPDATHQGWPEWFQKVGTALVAIGSPMSNRAVVPSGGQITDLNGYSIIQAETIDDAVRLVQDHPYLAQGGNDYSIEIFELPKQ